MLTDLVNAEIFKAKSIQLVKTKPDSFWAGTREWCHKRLIRGFDSAGKVNARVGAEDSRACVMATGPR